MDNTSLQILTRIQEDTCLSYIGTPQQYLQFIQVCIKLPEFSHHFYTEAKNSQQIFFTRELNLVNNSIQKTRADKLQDIVLLTVNSFILICILNPENNLLKQIHLNQFSPTLEYILTGIRIWPLVVFNGVISVNEKINKNYHFTVYFNQPQKPQLTTQFNEEATSDEEVLKQLKSRKPHFISDQRSQKIEAVNLPKQEDFDKEFELFMQQIDKEYEDKQVLFLNKIKNDL